MWANICLFVFAVVAAQETRQPEVVSPLGKEFYGQVDARGMLAEADDMLAADPDDIERVVAAGQAYARLRHYRQAIDIYTRGIESHPEEAILYRHRGHRFITLREFGKARRDLEKASALNGESFEIWYHLGLAYYLDGDFQKAAEANRRGLEVARNDDDVVAASYWLYLALARLGKTGEAEEVLDAIEPSMDIRQNVPYFKLLQFFKGRLPALAVFDETKASPIELATYGYGIACQYLVQGDGARAKSIFERIMTGPHWPAFGYIAAEAELARGVV